MQRLLLGIFLISVLLFSGCKEKAQAPATASENRTEFTIGRETAKAPAPTAPIRDGSTVSGLADVLKTVNPAALLQDMADRVRETDMSGTRGGNLDIAVSMEGAECAFSVSSVSRDSAAALRVLADLAGTELTVDGYVSPETGLLAKIPALSEDWACLFTLSGNFGIDNVSMERVRELVGVALNLMAENASYTRHEGTYKVASREITGIRETWTWGPEELSAMENGILTAAYEYGILEDEPGRAEANDTVKLERIAGGGYAYLSLLYGDGWECREFQVTCGEDFVDVWEIGQDNYLFYDLYNIELLSAKKNSDGSWTVLLNPYETVYGEYGNTREFEDRKVAVKIKENADGCDFSFSGEDLSGKGTVGITDGKSLTFDISATVDETPYRVSGTLAKDGLNATLRMQGLTAVISADMENRLGSVVRPDSYYDDFSGYMESLPDDALEGWLGGLFDIMGKITVTE